MEGVKHTGAGAPQASPPRSRETYRTVGKIETGKFHFSATVAFT